MSNATAQNFNKTGSSGSGGYLDSFTIDKEILTKQEADAWELNLKGLTRLGADDSFGTPVQKKASSHIF